MIGSSDSPDAMPTPRYGPGTPAIRRFLQRLAGLNERADAEVVAAYQRVSMTRAFERADAALGASIARSDRAGMRDALAGPFLQIVRQGDVVVEEASNVAPIAEPALAAVLALLMRDVLRVAEFEVLYEPFATAIPLSALAEPSKPAAPGQ